MGRTPKPPAPDPALGAAAMKQAKIAEEMLGMSRQQMAYQREQDAKNYALATQQFDYQKGILDKQMGWASQDRQRMMDVYRPLEDQVIRDAQGWDQADNMNRRAAQAQADVQQAIRQQNATTSQNMLNMGVNPNSGRFAGGLRSQAFQNAALQAGLQNQTRGQLLNEAQAMRANATQMGNQLIGQSYGALTGAGQTAGGLMNPYLEANRMSLAGFSTGMQGMGQAGNANAQSFDMQNKIYQNNLDIWRQKAQNKAARTSAIVGGISALAAPFTGGASLMLGGKLAAGAAKPGETGFENNSYLQNVGLSMLGHGR